MRKGRENGGTQGGEGWLLIIDSEFHLRTKTVTKSGTVLHAPPNAVSTWDSSSAARPPPPPGEPTGPPPLQLGPRYFRSEERGPQKGRLQGATGLQEGGEMAACKAGLGSPKALSSCPLHPILMSLALE